MDYNKSWWKSKTVLASVGALIVACGAAAFGEGSAAVAIIVSLLSAIGIYGRVNAKTTLTK